MKAFPCKERCINPFTDDYITKEHTGMDLRDYFAAKVINGMISNGDCYNINLMAKYAYEMADAMMKAREE